MLYNINHKAKLIALCFILYGFDPMPAELIKIGELAKLAKVLPSTIHYYTKEGLLKFADETQGGYRLYDRVQALGRIRTIQSLQLRNRLTISEIKKRIKK